jgi:hypothetical protein
MNANYLILILSLWYVNSTAQKADFIVTTTFDTIHVDKITLTDFKIKTKTAEKKKSYQMEEVISYYVSDENIHYERVLNPSEKKELPKVDRYDYKRLESLHVEEYKNRIKYKFFQRLTDGKVKLFCEVLKEAYYDLPSQPTAFIAEKKVYYIAIYDAKLELIKFQGEFELNDELYEILKEYLHGNDKIQSKLESLHDAVPRAKEKQIIALINAYNSWVKSTP